MDCAGEDATCLFEHAEERAEVPTRALSVHANLVDRSPQRFEGCAYWHLSNTNSIRVVACGTGL